MSKANQTNASQFYSKSYVARTSNQFLANKKKKLNH